MPKIKYLKQKVCSSVVYNTIFKFKFESNSIPQNCLVRQELFFTYIHLLVDVKSRMTIASSIISHFFFLFFFSQLYNFCTNCSTNKISNGNLRSNTRVFYTVFAVLSVTSLARDINDYGPMFQCFTNGSSLLQMANL